MVHRHGVVHKAQISERVSHLLYRYRSIRRSSEYLMSHYGPSDISLRHAELAGKVTRTDKQMQQAAKQDEKARRRHTGKRRITQSKADQKNKQDDNRHKNIHIYDQSRKPKTMTTQKRPCASCTLLRGWRLKTSEYRRFIGSVNSPPGFRPDIGELTSV